MLFYSLSLVSTHLSFHTPPRMGDNIILRLGSEISTAIFRFTIESTSPKPEIELETVPGTIAAVAVLQRTRDTWALHSRRRRMMMWMGVGLKSGWLNSIKLLHLLLYSDECSELLLFYSATMLTLLRDSFNCHLIYLLPFTQCEYFAVEAGATEYCAKYVVPGVA